ncbi:MAG: NlpC/P60 family protein [Chthonomonadaceae bacterium]|nr:NlpC/P60 family protein [Chthonomonadaceae bacterium]
MENVVAIFTHNVVPLFAEANTSSEQISQGLLGDTARVLAQSEGFVQVRTADDYTGWVRAIHLRALQSPDPLDSIAGEYPNAQTCLVGAAFADVWETPDRTRLRTKLVWGSRVLWVDTAYWRTGNYAIVLLPAGGYEATVGLPFSLCYMPAETLERPAHVRDFNGDAACALAHRFIGTPYLWGGGTPFGFDCSGFVQRIYSVLGITIPRDAYLQAQSPLGTFREPGKTMKAGDLVFFARQSDPRGRGITHVGIALDNKQFLHAVGKTGVTLSAFDSPEVRDVYTVRGAWRVNLARVKAAGKV